MADAGPPPSQTPFVDVAASAGLPRFAGMCLVFDDLDGDGSPDLLVDAMSQSMTQTMQIFSNDGAGHFQPRAFSWQPASGTYVGSCMAGDLDGDGLADVTVTIFNALEVRVLHNAGGGSFQELTALKGAAPANQSGSLGYSASALADFDLDGRLDVLAASFVDAPQPGALECRPTSDGFSCFVASTRCAPPPVVFRNAGGGKFDPPASVVDPSSCGPANSNAVGITDWNDDGRPDVFVANDWGVDALYVQTQTALKFTDVAPTLATKRYNHGMGVAFSDFDADGTLDYYVADLGSDQLYLGIGAGQVVARAKEWGVAVDTEFHSGWAPIADDFDDDGLPDVWLVNAGLVRDYADLTSVGLGSQLAPRPQADFFLRNVGGARFDLVQVMQTSDAEPRTIGGTSAVADYDGDGRLDVVEAMGFPLRLQLLHNQLSAGHWIDARLHGTTSNRDGIGAVVTLNQSGRRPQRRLVTRSRGTVGASWAVAHFGLGSRTDVDSIDVAWPSGKRSTVPTPKADGVVAIMEP